MRVELNLYDSIADELADAAAQAVQDTAEDIARAAAQLAPHRTGQLGESVAARPLDRHHWLVEVGAYYGVFHEFGTVKMDATPFVVPAAEGATPRWAQRIAGLLG